MKIPLRLISAIIFALFLIALGLILPSSGQTQSLAPEDEPSAGIYEIDRISSGNDTVEVFEDTAGVIAVRGGVSAGYKDVQQLISALASGDTVVFMGVKAQGDISINKDLTVKGTLNIDAGSLTVTGGGVLLDYLDLTLSGGSLDIGAASVRSQGGTVCSDSDRGVRLLFDTSSYIADNTVIRHTGDEAAILVQKGSCLIKGGRVESSAGYAVDSRGELTLCGSPMLISEGLQIITSSPVALSDGVGNFSGELSICWSGALERGSLTALLTSVGDLNNVKASVYDEDGNKLTLASAEELNLKEKDKLYLYLPFLARFYSRGALVDTREFLCGDILTPPDVKVPDGYVSLGWYTDEGLTNTADFTKGQYEDRDFYYRMSLVKPAFSINPLEFVYDGAYHVLNFDDLSHPLASSGAFSFDWYKDGEPIFVSTRELSLMKVSDSGAYSCIITFAHGGDYVKVDTGAINVRISPIRIPVPTVENKEYTGFHQLADVTESRYYVIENLGGTDVGSYPVVFTMKDAENYSFLINGTDIGTSSVTVDFLITKANNYFLSFDIHSSGYTGCTPVFSAFARFGEVKLLFSESSQGPWSDEVPRMAGVYWCIGSVEETENYSRATSTPVKLTFTDEAVVGLRIDTLPTKTAYKAFEGVNLAGAAFTATYNSGRSESIGASDVSVIYPSGSMLYVGDTAVTLSYRGVSVPLGVTVAKAEYDVSSLNFSDKTVVYDTGRHTIMTDGEIIGIDGYPLYYRISGGGTDVGSYTVTVSFSGKSPNYHTPKPITATLTVTPCPLKVTYSDTNFVYDGTVKVPRASVTLLSGKEAWLSVMGGGVNAGKYSATASAPGENYTLSNPTVDFEIQKALIDVSGITWSEGVFEYDALYHTVTADGAPDGVTIIGYVGNRAKDAGEYTAKAVLSYDERNYLLRDEVTLNWRILKADYDMSAVFFKDTSAVYDGKVHYPSPASEMPKGLDGVTLRYEFSGGASQVSEGRVRVTVIFSTSSGNYNTPDPMEAFVEIKPKGINVSWQGGVFVYDGEPKAPLAYSIECPVSVEGAMVDVGSYTALAVCASDNFTVLNSTMSFVIEKAKNSWITPPSVEDVYFGKAPSPISESRFGGVTYKYYLDAALAVECAVPKAVGTYYMVAEVPETKNYYQITGQPVAFRIIPILPVGIEVTVSGGMICAKRPVGADEISAYLRNNDGSLLDIPYSSLSISYQNGPLPLFGDTSLSVSYGGFSLVLSVSVIKADYDMSRVRWENVRQVYDGTVKFAYLTGLPAGVKIVDYTANSGTEAGVYSLSARLSYDEANYNPPILPKGELMIEKQKVELPTPESFVYDGLTHAPVLPASSLYSVSVQSGRDAGMYKLTFTLKDPGNYDFGAEGNVIYYEIAKRPISLKVCRDGKSYILESGSIIDGDDLDVSYYSEGSKIYLRVNSPNYDATVTPYDRQSAFLIVSGAALLAILLISLSVIGIYLYRRRGEVPAPPDGAAVVEEAQGIERILLAVDEEQANSMISDSLARSMVNRSKERIVTSGTKRIQLNIGLISDAFSPRDTVDINAMKAKGLIPENVCRVKIIGKGIIDKPLTVMANGFSLAAAKMICLTGGEPVRVSTVKAKHRNLASDPLQNQ